MATYRSSLSLPTWITVGIMALGMLGGWFTTYHKADSALTSRVSALEAHQMDGDTRLDHIQSQVDRLVTWALGSK